MLKYDEFLKESLASQILDQPKSKAMSQAQKMGLTYVGFGRFADNQGTIAYLLDGDNLVPFTNQQDMYANYNKASTSGKNEKTDELKKQADQYTNTVYKRTQNDQKILSDEGNIVMQVDQALKEFYNDSMFDSMEINTLIDFVSSDFEVVNTYLYQGFDPGTDEELAGFVTQMVDEIDILFEDSQAPFNYSVYTCLSGRYNPSQIEMNSEYVFRGYVSTSLDYNVCIESATEEAQMSSVTLLQIDIGQGQKSIYTEAFTQSGEMETMLPRGSKIVVVSGPHSLPSDVLLGSGSQLSITMFYCQLVEEI